MSNPTGMDHSHQAGEAGIAPAQVQFALISHTNNGKTTLARTLTGADVGEVRDAAHVTVTAEAHLLMSTPEDDTLRLWDTPGFGDSVRLFKRLAIAGNPIGWFLREVIDRYRDRPLWLSQQAMRTARESSDVVLYLVNSSEHPRDAGYLPSEMRILEWLEKPVLVLLNQMGPPRPAPDEAAERARWREHLRQYPVVRDVLALDAFARCWVHERVFYETIGSLLPMDKVPGYKRLVASWESMNLVRFHSAMRLTAQGLAAAAKDREPVQEPEQGQGQGRNFLKATLNAVSMRKGSDPRQERAMGTLVERLERSIGTTTASLLELYRLDPSDAAKINARVRRNFVVRAPIDKAQAGLLGAVISGAATGLSADAMAGGLTLGAGALLGGIVGAVTFAGAAWGFNTTTERSAPVMQFADDFLRTLAVASILRYLAVIHFGRGRGNFVESEAPAFWQEEVERAVAEHDGALREVWASLRESASAAASAVATTVAEGATRRLEGIVAETCGRVLGRLYPDAHIDATGLQQNAASG